MRRRLTGRIGWRPGGWLLSARGVPSPHQDARPAGERVTLLVLHGISLPPGRFSGDHVERLFTGRLGQGDPPDYPELRGLRVSAHFFVRRNGLLLQFVGCERRAWHAGVSRWQGRERCNDFSIGIELEGTDRRPYTGRQYHCLALLVKALQRRYPITDIVGHSDIAPGRKTDPGPAFYWPGFGRLLGR